MRSFLFFALAVSAQIVPAAAQTSDPITTPPSKAADETGAATDALAADILVTATKRGAPEKVQAVAIAVTALGSAQIEARFVRDLQSLTFDIPNAQLDSVGTTAGYANFSILGLGINDSISSIDPTVGVFVDCVEVSRKTGQAAELFPIRRLDGNDQGIA